MNSRAPVHLGLERIILAAQFLARVARGLRTAFAIEQKPFASHPSALQESAVRA